MSTMPSYLNPVFLGAAGLAVLLIAIGAYFIFKGK